MNRLLARGSVLGAIGLGAFFLWVAVLAGQTPTGFIFESAWANFFINLLTFMLAGHVVGSCWYLFGLQVRQQSENSLQSNNILYVA